MKKNHFIIIFLFSLIFLGITNQPVYSEAERIEKLSSQQIRIEQMKKVISSFFILAEKSDKKVIIENTLNQLTEKIEKIQERIRKELIEAMSGSENFNLSAEGIYKASDDNVFIEDSSITKNVELARIKLSSEGIAIIDSIDFRISSSTMPERILEKVFLYSDGKIISESRGISRRMSFDIDDFMLYDGETKEIVLRADIYGIDRIKEEGARLRVSLEKVNYSDYSKNRNKSIDKKIDFDEYYFHTGVPSFYLEDSVYSYVEVGEKSAVDIIFTFKVTAKERDIYLPENASFILEGGKMSVRTSNNFLIKETGNLAEKAGDISPLASLKSITNARKSGNAYLIRKGSSEVFELWISIKANKDISRVGVVYLDTIPWGVNSNTGMKAGTRYFENIFKTNRLVEDKN